MSTKNCIKDMSILIILNLLLGNTYFRYKLYYFQCYY